MKKNNYCILFVLINIFLASCAQQLSQGTELIYVANEGDGTISVIDAKSLNSIDTIKLNGKPHNVNVDPLGRYFYATNHEGDDEETHDETNHNEMNHVPYLRIIDAKTNKLQKSIPMEYMAAHVVPSKDGNYVYVSREGGDTVVEVDLIKSEISRTFKSGQGPHGIVLSNDGKTIYSPNMRSNDVSIIEVKTGNEKRIELNFDGNKCETPVAMGITNDDKYSFVTCGKSFDIYKIDNQDKKIAARLELKKGEFPGPIQVPVHPDNKYLYVPDMRNGVVHKINIEKFELEKDIPTADGAHGIAFSSDGKTAYVTNTWDNSLSVLDLTSDSVVKKVEVGLKPNGVAVTNGKNQGW